MEYLVLDEIKKHLNIEESFTDDDEYIESLGIAAEEATAKYIDFPLSNLEDESGDIPRSLKHAMLLLIGNWYACRESATAASVTVVPQAYEFLCDLHRDYKLMNEK